MTTLSELREANLAEQKAVRTSVSTEVRKPVSTEVLTDGSNHVLTEVLPQVPAETAPPTARRSASPKRPAEPYLDRVREAIARKTIHPGGVKATVEMSPELSLRAKRYCLDHANVPVRQVFLDLMAAFLDEEGY